MVKGEKTKDVAEICFHILLNRAIFHLTLFVSACSPLPVDEGTAEQIFDRLLDPPDPVFVSDGPNLYAWHTHGQFASVGSYSSRTWQ
jgi:hypothetical protein